MRPVCGAATLPLAALAKISFFLTKTDLAI